MLEKHEPININDIDFDKENPRIKKSLEKYKDDVDETRIFFALKSASSNGNDAASSFKALEDSIIASGGAQQEIVVIKKNGRYTCIDGNTRLAIYKTLLKNQAKGSWTHIKAKILINWEQEDLEKVRITAHLVGARDWPAYEKARYLHQLRYEKLLDYDQIIQLAGGNSRDIQQRIDAYENMNEHYRDKVSDDAFKIERFSGFVELQKAGIKDSIFDAGLTLDNFGEWIRDGKIYKMADVRQLPKVLRNDETKKIFLEGGPKSINSAIETINHKEREKLKKSHTTLESATIYQLTDVLIQKIGNLPFDQVSLLRDRQNKDSNEKIRLLETLSLKLQELINNVSE